MAKTARQRLTRPWIGLLGNVDPIRNTATRDRSRWQQARLDSVEWAQRGGWIFTGLVGIAPIVLGGVVGWAFGQLPAGVASAVASLALLYVVSFAFFAWRAPEKQLADARLEIANLHRQEQARSQRAPELTLGTVHVPRDSQQIVLGDGPWDSFMGRVLRVPVTNAGVETATSVQALLTFMPSDESGQWSPRDPALAEWDTEPVVTAIDIPGNGQPHLFYVAFVLDRAHVCVHQWTRHSREAKLQGYGIAGRGIIRVEVRGAGPYQPSVTDTLHVEALDGLLSAQWESEGLGTRRNCVPWNGPPLMGPPPGT